MKTFIITGPESSGKTVLSQSLAQHFDAILIPEYARYYLNSISRDYTSADVIEISRHQSRTWWTHVLYDDKLIFIDTWNIVIYTWLNYKYNLVPDFVKASLNFWRKDCHFLLCKPDIPWTPDPLRENPHNREELYKMYIEVLERYGLSYSIIMGENRLEQAVNIVEEVKRN